ncbi:MAG: hypothetical protein ABI432_15125, partial [Flavobacteriales bacterium]
MNSNMLQLPMVRHIFLTTGLFLALGGSAQTLSQQAAVQLSATVQSSPARITVSWATAASTTSITIYRKLRSATTWGSAIATPAPTATQYQDNAVTVGTAYDYRVVRVAGGATGSGYVASGIEVPPTDYRGKIILLVDNTLAPQLVPELQQLETDLLGDGWTVLRSDVSRSATVTSVRNVVIGHYNSDPANVKALFIIGHVPVPYSGNINPDGHSQHLGAWPCDGYYGDINGTWTDATVNNTTSQRVENRNTPGDGKFDQNNFPNEVELQVGRVDMYDMPAFSQSEVQLMRNYFSKAHSFKMKVISPQARGIVFDNLQWIDSPIAASGWRNMAPLVGAANVSGPNPYAGNFTGLINNQSYLWTYSSGGGLQAYEGTVLTFNGADLVATTQNYATTTSVGGVFNMTFGSYYGDWDNKDNFLRATIASGNALVNTWVGIPAWYFQHMGQGEGIGYSTWVSMNNSSVYTPLTEGWQSSIGRTHLALMGDPSLRMKMIIPPTGFTVSNASGVASFGWTASSEAVLGYHIYKFNGTGAITRLTTTPVTGTTYLNAAIPFIAGAQYMVRAVKLETNFSGSYYNLSLGAIATAAGSPVVDCLGVSGGPALPGTSCNDSNACTTGDTWNASCQCAGTASGDTDGDGICNAQDNCPTLAGQIGSTCNDGNACTINDVINASCQCAGTASGDTDGDGICNAQDN